MEFNYKYKGSTSIKSNSSETGMTFVPDVYREPTFFTGKLNKKIPFREAISALHHIVVSDFRYSPKDNGAYLEWAKQQEGIWLAEAMLEHDVVKEELLAKQTELRTLYKESHKIMKPFYDAQSKYFKHLYIRDRAAWIVLDPVISVHPDELFFECFSKDESTYGKLSCNYNVFKEIGDFECGTTNIDYSVPLYKEFQKIRNYKDTAFEIDPSGFEVQTTAEEAYKESKIDLPDSWVRGFLQVSSAMVLDAFQFEIDPIDLSNFLFLLKRNKEKHGPRSIRWILKTGEPVKAIFEPWNKEIVCRRSIYTGSNEGEVRMWGRRRLSLLERLLPVSQKISVNLLGTGLPSFFIVDLGDMTFTMGLSGWTANDWSRSSNFDLMTPRYETDGLTQQKIFLALKEDWFASADAISKKTQLSKNLVESAMTNFIQEGKVVYDLHKKVYRVRELTKDPLPIDKLRYKNEREEAAVQLLQNQNVKYDSYEMKGKVIWHYGQVISPKKLAVSIGINEEERMVNARCECRFYKENKLYQGPCEHMMALRKLGTVRIDKIVN